MKSFFTRNFFMLLFIFSFAMTNAQTFPYVFSAETGTYAELTGAIELSSVGDEWDDPEYVVPIGFDFDFLDTSGDSLYYVGVGAGLLLNDLIANANSLNILYAYFDDLMDIENADPNTQSTISYLTEGAAGSRIFKMEWKDAGFFNEIDYVGTANNRVSLQLWLYETSNTIEVRFGPNNIVDPMVVHETGGPVVGFIDSLDFTSHNAFWVVTGAPGSPTIENVSFYDFSNYTFASLDSHPVDGQIYRFASTSTALSDPTSNLTAKVYPSLVEHEFFVEVGQEFLEDNTQINVANSIGQIIYNKTITNAKERLDASNFPKGIYYVTVINESGKSTQKIMKN